MLFQKKLADLFERRHFEIVTHTNTFLIYALIIPPLALGLLNFFSGYFAIDDSSYGKIRFWIITVQIGAIAASFAIIIRALIRPFLVLIDNVSNIQNSVSQLSREVSILGTSIENVSNKISAFEHKISDFEDKISAFEHKISDFEIMLSAITNVYVRWREDTGIVLDFINNSQLKWSHTYSGLDIPKLTSSLVKLAKQNPNHELYIHPRILPDIVTLDWPPAIIYAVDCPREACYVIGGPSSDRALATHVLIVRSEHSEHAYNQPCWSATIKADSDYAKYLERTYRNHYHGKPAIVLDSPTKARFLKKLHETRTDEDEDIFAGFLAFPDWQKEYNFAEYLLEHATKSILAVDFMRPSKWASDPMSTDPMSTYIKAHKRNKLETAEKERVHIFKIADLNEARKGSLEKYSGLRKAYMDYIDLHHDMGFKLYFCSKGNIRNLTGGFMIIDDTVVFYEKTDRHKTTAGKENCASFADKEITRYKNTFKVIKERAVEEGEFVERHLPPPKSISALKASDY